MIEKIINIQKDLKVPKNNLNKFGGYNYRSCEDILEGLKPLLAEEGLMQTITDEIVQVGERFYIKATVTVSDGEKTHSVSAFAREALTKKGQDDSQITGTASSYARKYALNGLWLIDDTKDADTNEHTNQQQQRNGRQGKPKMTPKYRGWDGAVAAVAEGKYTIEQIKLKYTLSEADEATMKQQVHKLQEAMNEPA